MFARQQDRRIARRMDQTTREVDGWPLARGRALEYYIDTLQSVGCVGRKKWKFMSNFEMQWLTYVEHGKRLAAAVEMVLKFALYIR